MLKQHGLIAAYGKKGFAVSELQIDLVRHLYQIRGHLDRLALAQNAGGTIGFDDVVCAVTLIEAV